MSAFTSRSLLALVLLRQKMTLLQVLRQQPFVLSRRGLQFTCRSYAADAAAKAPKEGRKASEGSSPSASSSVPRSSCATDTILTGVNYLKGQAPVVALADDTYPEWLWQTLQPRVYDDDGPGGKKERVERRKLRQQAIKDRNFMQTQ